MSRYSISSRTIAAMGASHVKMPHASSTAKAVQPTIFQARSIFVMRGEYSFPAPTDSPVI